jgi:hypothetical protein
MIQHLIKQSEEMKEYFTKDKNPISCLTHMKQTLHFAYSRDQENAILGHKIHNKADLSLHLVYSNDETSNEGDFILKISRFNIKIENKNRKYKNKKQVTTNFERGVLSNGIIEKYLQLIEEKDFEENNFSIPPRPTKIKTEIKIITLYSKIFIGKFFFNSKIFILFFLGGRYNKYSREISQSNWVADGKRVGKYSVEEILMDPVKEIIKCRDMKFVSSGREDIDVRMMGNGRPFILTLIEPETVPTEEQLLFCTEKINSSQVVKISNFKLRSKEEYNLLNESAEKKEKKYRCLIKSEKLVSSLDFSSLHNKELTLQQSTPIRVLNRRAQKKRF